MYVIEVIPLIRGTQVESLSYYASVDFPVGSLLTVPVRKKDITGIVINTKPVGAAKTALKAATFSLRKLTEKDSAGAIPANLIKTASLISEQYPAGAGALLYALLPPDIRSGVRQYPETDSIVSTEDPTPSLYTGPQADRFLVYKSYIREAFAHRGSVLLVVPNSAAVAGVKAALETGIEKRVITFSSTSTKRQLDKSYTDFADLSSAKLIIATPSFAFLERSDLTHIILEESGSSHYQARTRPYLDARVALKTYAKVTKRSILLGDLLPLSEDEEMRRSELYSTYDSHPKRVQFNSSFTIAQHTKTDSQTEWKLITPELHEITTAALKNKGQVFYYAARKGLAPLVLCYDCGYIFKCSDSGAPYSLLRTDKNGEEQRWFVCSTSGKRVRAADVCPGCGSWRLREQGIGIQHIEDVVKEEFPQSTILRLDHQTANTYNKAKKIIEQFYESKNVLLLGTAMALPYLQKQIDVSAVTSYEALRSNPTWRAEAATLRTLLQLRERTRKDFVIQTRDETDQLLKYAERGQLDSFYDEEIMVRKALKYPPFAYFILLTYAGETEQIAEIEMNLTQHLAGYSLESYNAPLTGENGRIRHSLMRIEAKDWPDTHLMTALRALPPYIKIEINPERVV